MTARTDGHEALALPDLERRVANGIRFGKVMAVDLANARVRIKSGEIETTWLPWSTGRAHPSKRRWDPPAVGEQVVVLSPCGDLSQGVAMVGVFQDTAAAPSASADKDSAVYGDGAVIEYDQASHTLLADLQGTKVHADRTKIELTVGGVVLTISASGVAITGGQVTHNGINIGDTHTHIGSPTAPPGPITPTGAPL